MTNNGDPRETEVIDFSPEVRAYEAKEVGLLLEKETVKTAFAATERRIMKEWEAGENPLSREMAWHKLQAFKTLKAELRALADRRGS